MSTRASESGRKRISIPVFVNKVGTLVTQQICLPPPDVPLTPRQQALLTEPADPHTFVPSLFSDGPGAKRA